MREGACSWVTKPTVYFNWHCFQRTSLWRKWCIGWLLPQAHPLLVGKKSVEESPLRIVLIRGEAAGLYGSHHINQSLRTVPCEHCQAFPDLGKGREEPGSGRRRLSTLSPECCGRRELCQGCRERWGGEATLLLPPSVWLLPWTSTARALPWPASPVTLSFSQPVIVLPSAFLHLWW